MQTLEMSNATVARGKFNSAHSYVLAIASAAVGENNCSVLAETDARRNSDSSLRRPKGVQANFPFASFFPDSYQDW